VSFNRADGKLLFVNECPPSTQAFVDITMFLAALKNLVKNGFAYNDSINKQIEVKAKLENNQILFSVMDNGVGFPPEYLDGWGRIQGQAARLDPTKEGTGTGLFSVRGIIEAHKGASVSILSKQGVGSTFLIKVGIGS
jgi:signal transduction histidine kinase